ncbi:putative TBC domain protein [Cladophialophora carrionii]|uniref:Putative TBC domain protein n=1 Tax=Cladophialophora carrionii TaxID=86049 RepID=A0A1C1CDE0_9EURO|nr:putative TBC domain protein [Cladophialophora carrionii]
MSAPSARPPIARPSSPGVEPEPRWESFPLGCAQAWTLDPTDLGIVEVVDVDSENGRWTLPTFVPPKPAKPRPAEIASLARQNTVVHSARSSEITFPPLTASLLETYSRKELEGVRVDVLSLKSAQGLDLALRSLTPLSHAHNIFTMATTMTEAPGSPPELSGSRSSKSSSSYSSSFSSPDDSFESDITNFEEIGLEDEKHTTSKFTHSRDVSMQSVGSQHELIKAKEVASGEKRPTLPQLQTRVKASGPRQDSAPPRTNVSRMAMFKRGFTSSETFYPPNNMRTRSSSPPSRRHPASASTPSLSAGGLRPIPPSSASSLGLPSRRASWQPHRKTVEELEAEYHDSDDDLPEDASLWNVPVSPHPSGLRSHRSSFRGSPDRYQAAPSPRPIPLEHARTAPEVPPRPALHSQQGLPKSKPPPQRSVSLTPASSNPSSPRKGDFAFKNRTKSWNLAMADLSEEAKIISEALEFHAEARDQERLDRLQGGSSRGSLETPTDRSSRASSIQLPPIQKSTLDFMPISKEKEAILSRTRPSWLPPKDPKEEKKHLKEYQRMMAASIEADKKRRMKLQVQQCEKDDTRQTLNRIWHFYVDEATDLTTIDKRVNDLCWRGISPNLRGKVWQRAIGNPLGLTAQSYAKALNRAKEIKKRTSDQLDQDEKSMGRWFVDIERDAETAFPELSLFQRGAPLWQDLIDVCEAYACYRSDVGYIYGIQLMAALLLLQLPTPSEAFILLANCLNRPVPLAFQTDEKTMTSRTYNHAVSTLAIKFPRLHEYLFGSLEQGGLGFRGEEVFEPMLRTIFSNGLDVDRLCRVWDIWIFEGDRTLVNAAVAVLGSLQSQLFGMEGNLDLKRRNTQEMLGWGPFNRLPRSGHWNLQTVGDEDRFVDEIRLAGTLDYTGR